MKKDTVLRNIQKRLPDDILIKDNVSFELTEEEYFSILVWIKVFNIHFKEFGKSKNMPLHIIPISSRCCLDVYFYRFPDDNNEYVIYLKEEERLYKDNKLKKPSITDLISRYDI